VSLSVLVHAGGVHVSTNQATIAPWKGKGAKIPCAHYACLTQAKLLQRLWRNARRRRARSLDPGGAQRHPGFAESKRCRTPRGVRGILASLPGCGLPLSQDPGFRCARATPGYLPSTPPAWKSLRHYASGVRKRPNSRGSPYWGVATFSFNKFIYRSGNVRGFPSLLMMT
jgi:hypothetical protein